MFVTQLAPISWQVSNTFQLCMYSLAGLTSHLSLKTHQVRCCHVTQPTRHLFPLGHSAQSCTKQNKIKKTDHHLYGGSLKIQLTLVFKTSIRILLSLWEILYLPAQRKVKESPNKEGEWVWGGGSQNQISKKDTLTTDAS